MRPARMLGALMLGCGFGLGCHAVWTHPDATAEKYNRDLYYCRYGVEPDPNLTEAEIRQRALLLQRKDWKQCMTALGWTKTTGSASSEPWGRSD